MGKHLTEQLAEAPEEVVIFTLVLLLYNYTVNM